MKREINMLYNGKNTNKKIGEPADMKGEGSIVTDPNGSYTGVPTVGGKYEQPIQDADDL